MQDVEDINDILVFEEVRVKQKRQTCKSSHCNTCNKLVQSSEIARRKVGVGGTDTSTQRWRKGVDALDTPNQRRVQNQSQKR